MAKCGRCNKKGMFLKLNIDGLCPECVVSIEKEEQERRKKAVVDRPRPTTKKENYSLSKTQRPLPSSNDIQLPETNILGDKWEISVSFGKSSSKSFDRALYIAKSAKKYDEFEIGKDVVHQAWFGPQKEEYLNFIRLYELVSNWKSSAVMINGELTDRKIIGGINYCYGDKCRNGRSDFCFGASEYTENPFGCHRLQVSTCNNPWWTFGNWRGNIFYVDKKAILTRINEYSTAYRVCPDFNYDAVLYRLELLPDKISKSEYDAILMGDRRFMKAFRDTKLLK